MPFDVGDFKLPVETKPDVFSLEGLVAWLENQNPETEYRYSDSCGCLMGAYLKANNSYVEIGGANPRFSFEVDYMEVLNPQRRLSYVGTYGAALARARALLVR